MKNFNKKKNLTYFPVVISSLLILMMISQNCVSKNNSSVLPQTPGLLPLKGPMNFEIKYEGERAIFDILWQVRVHHYNEYNGGGCYIGSYKKINFRETDLNIEVDQNDVLQIDNTLGVNVFAQAFIQFEEADCITYRKGSLQLVPFDSKKADPICQQATVLPPHINPTSSMNPTSPYMIESINKSLYHFSVGDSIGLELVNLRNENTQFTWSIKNMGDDIELADQTHQDTTITHTFSNKGVYDISAIERETNFEISTQLLIGKCEDTEASEEIIIDMTSATSN